MDQSEVKRLPKVDHTPAELDEPSKALLRAADLIERRGWARLVQQDAEGKLCLLGAILRAVTGDFRPGNVHLGGMPDERVSLYKMAAAKLSNVGVDPESAHHWNNELGRTQADVVAKLRSAAFSG